MACQVVILPPLGHRMQQPPMVSDGGENREVIYAL
jgi:hypothetical protein